MSIAYKVSARNRGRKWRIFMEEFKPRADTKVLDVGFAENEYAEMHNYIERHYPYPQNLTALGVELPTTFQERYPSVAAVYYEGDIFPFEDNVFDICWSNAVVEHVGDRGKQVAFLREIDRVSECAYITTPNRWFPIEVHTLTPLLHYLPKSMFDRYLSLVKKNWAVGGYMHLLSLSELESVLKDAGISEYKVFKNRFLGFVMDYAVVLHPPKVIPDEAKRPR